MPKGTKKCKICGKDYEYCRSMLPDTDMFRWQDVACCKEHGEQYLRLVLEARGELSVTEQTSATDEQKSRKHKKKTDAAVSAETEEMA